jgi:hypothetical protein
VTEIVITRPPVVSLDITLPQEFSERDLSAACKHISEAVTAVIADLLQRKQVTANNPITAALLTAAQNLEGVSVAVSQAQQRIASPLTMGPGPGPRRMN